MVSRSLSILHKYKLIFKDDKEKGEEIQSLAQFYIQKFNDSVKITEKQVETEVVLSSLEKVK